MIVSLQYYDSYIFKEAMEQTDENCFIGEMLKEISDHDTWDN